MTMDSLRVGFFTHTPTEIAFSFYRDAMENSGYIRFLSKIEEGEQCDVLLVMQHSDDLRSLSKFKKANPQIFTGVVDPRGAHVHKSLSDFDFLVVDSLEKRDYFLGFGRPVFLYHDVLHLPHQSKKHRNTDRTIIGYHGNRVHLEAMAPVVTTALERLGDERPLEFWAIYNHEHLGKWTWEPKNIHVRHIQWDRDQFPAHLAEMDIGISPNSMPLINPINSRRKMAVYPKFFNEKDEDFLIRFKVPTNPGRIYVFANASIPVVSDVAPSAMRWIEPGVSGEIAHHTGAWYHALRALALDSDLRDRYSAQLWAKMKVPFSPEHQNLEFFNFLKALLFTARKGLPLREIPHEELRLISGMIYRWKFFSIVWKRKFSNLILRVRRKVFNS